MAAVCNDLWEQKTSWVLVSFCVDSLQLSPTVPSHNVWGEDSIKSVLSLGVAVAGCWPWWLVQVVSRPPLTPLKKVIAFFPTVTSLATLDVLLVLMIENREPLCLDGSVEVFPRLEQTELTELHIHLNFPLCWRWNKKKVHSCWKHLKRRIITCNHMVSRVTFNARLYKPCCTHIFPLLLPWCPKWGQAVFLWLRHVRLKLPGRCCLAHVLPCYY